MSLYVNDERLDAYLPASITVYGDVKPKTAPIDCRTCKHGGMATCHLAVGHCVRGSEYKRAEPVQFWTD